MTQPYLFGFPSSVKAISFPGRPRILTVEVAGGPCPPGNYGANGEPFILTNPVGAGGPFVVIGPVGNEQPFVAAVPVGPSGPSGPFVLNGATGSNGVLTSSTPGSMTGSFQAFAPPPFSAPVITTPFDKDMLARFCAWEEPIPLYLSSDQSLAGGVLFFNVDNITMLLKNPKLFKFQINTKDHSVTPPGPPQFIYYLYLTGEGQPFPGPIVNATGNILTQSFFDQSGFLPPSVDPTSPAQVSTYGDEIGGVCDMYFQNPNQGGLYQSLFGVPFTPGPSTEAVAIEEIANLITMGFSLPGYVNYFAWAISPTPPPPGFCSWEFTVKTWRRATQFIVNLNGTIGGVSIVGPKNKLFPVKPIQTTTAVSRGANGPACTNTISVVPASMQFSISQKFS